jgi:hypothetical protein
VKALGLGQRAAQRSVSREVLESIRKPGTSGSARLVASQRLLSNIPGMTPKEIPTPVIMFRRVWPLLNLLDLISVRYAFISLPYTVRVSLSTANSRCRHQEVARDSPNPIKPPYPV